MQKKIITKTVSLNFWQRLYIIEALKGLWLTGGHFWRSLVNLIGYTFKLRKDRGNVVTIYYPEERRKLEDPHRTRHRLTQREDGTPKCVACMMCETICPCFCIHIEAADANDGNVERYPARFEIEILRCCFCGLCVEACPEDAIRMDTGIVEFSMRDRFSKDNYYDREFLLNSDPCVSNHPRRFGWEHSDAYPGERKQPVIPG